MIRISSPLFEGTAILLAFQVFALCTAAIFDDFTNCQKSGQLNASNGALVCDPEGRLTRNALAQLNSFLTDMEQNAGCECAQGCGGKPYAVRLLVTSGERVNQSGGPSALNETAKRIWEGEGMANSANCDNGMLLLYVRDQKQMAIFQGHQRFRIYSDSEIANLHEIVMHANRTGSAALLPSPGGDTAEPAAEVHRAENASALEPLVGISVALALIFFVLMCLVCILLCVCCNWLCRRRKRTTKTSKYYVNPSLPTYKSAEPIYIVTPQPGDSHRAPPPFTPPSDASLYGTATLPRGRSRFSPPPPPPPPPHPSMMFFGHPPPPGPFIQHPRSRSTTPTSTHRIRRTRQPSGGGGAGPSTSAMGGRGGGPQQQQSTHSTPEPNKRDKQFDQMRGTNGGPYHTPSSSHLNSTVSPPETTKHSAQSQQPSPSTREFPSSAPNQPYPFLDPNRKQEVQTRHEFIS